MKQVTAKQAAALIRDDSTITCGGFGHCGAPEALLAAIEERFLREQHPRRLSLLFASGAGDRGDKGINHLAHEGLLTSIVGGFWSLAPRIGQMVKDDRIEAHNWPQGVISHMYRAIAAGMPGVITKVGLKTFIDPERSGGKLNRRTVASRVERLAIAGDDFLLYKGLPLHCALLRGTRSDVDGNITMEREASFQDALAQAQAVRNSGGLVIVQVMDIVKAGGLDPHAIKIPGFLVDHVVVADADEHWQTYGEKYNPAFCQASQSVVPRSVDIPFGPKRIIARRAMLELMRVVDAEYRARPIVVNLGIGTPEQIAAVARQERLANDRFVLTVESGAVGGYPAGGGSFGATEGPQAVLTQAEQFDYYDGGGIDIAFLGFGEMDGAGRVNVCSMGSRLNGVGGFVNISQCAKRVFFCGSFTAAGLQVSYDPLRGLSIDHEGAVQKLVNEVEKVCYDPGGRALCRKPMLITERAVLTIEAGGLELLEIAPGCDVQRDVIAQSATPIRVNDHLLSMPAQAFNDQRLTPSFVT
jgi:propionate CoA-transferase